MKIKIYFACKLQIMKQILPEFYFRSHITFSYCLPVELCDEIYRAFHNVIRDYKHL